MQKLVKTAALLALLGCEPIAAPPPSTCHATVGDRVATSMEVCTNLSRRGCVLPDCAAAYSDYASRAQPEDFRRLTSCYAHATSCEQVDDCERACGSDGGMVALGPRRDGGADVAAEAATDVAAEAAVDVLVEAAVDASVEVGVDVSTEAAVDVSTEAAVDVSTEAAVDASVEAAVDVSVEAAVDATSEAVADTADDLADGTID